MFDALTSGQELVQETVKDGDLDRMGVYYTIQFSTILYYTVLYYTILYYTILHYYILYDTIV